jgi:hypothetical protein
MRAAPVPLPIMGEWEFGLALVLAALGAAVLPRPVAQTARPRFCLPARGRLRNARLACRRVDDPGWPPGSVPRRPANTGPPFPRSA